MLYLQTFQYYKWNNPIILESGVNIIGIMPGLNWATKQDRPLLVSSFWDIKVRITDLGMRMIITTCSRDQQPMSQELVWPRYWRQSGS